MTMDSIQGTPNEEFGRTELVSNGEATFTTWDSRTLLSGQREVIISHGDQQYRLRQTRNGKLILQK